MTRKELAEEIEFVHNNRTNNRLIRPLDVMREVIIEATDTYTNISSFMIDYELLYEDHLIDHVAYHSAMNDLYLLALLHTSCDEDLNNEV